MPSKIQASPNQHNLYRNMFTFCWQTLFKFILIFLFAVIIILKMNKERFNLLGDFRFDFHASCWGFSSRKIHDIYHFIELFAFQLVIGQLIFFVMVYAIAYEVRLNLKLDELYNCS